MKKKIVIGSLVVLMKLSGWAQNITNDPPFKETFFGMPLALDAKAIRREAAMRINPEEIFPAADDQAGFCSFVGVTNVTVQNGKLSFTMAKDTAMLGWGNVDGKKPNFKTSAFPERFDLNLAVHQSETCLWTVVYREPVASKIIGKASTGKVDKTGAMLGFDRISAPPSKDKWDPNKNELAKARPQKPGSLEFVIKGKTGSRMEIASVAIVQPAVPTPLYARYEFTLPEGKIWRAVADISGPLWCGFNVPNGVWLHVNGHSVEVRDPVIFGHVSHALDIAPYLVSGTNVVGIQWDVPNLSIPWMYFQSRIVMDSGAVVDVASGPGWRYRFAVQPEEGWNKPSFDVSSWGTISNKSEMVRAYLRRNDTGDIWLPAYQGRMVLANPAGRELVFADTANVVLEARIPAGMQPLAPRVVYKIGRCHTGTVEEVKSGAITDPRADGNDLVYRVDLGVLPGGVYVFAPALQDKSGAIFETRPREPFVVINTPRGRIVTGKNYTEGMDLELEDTIDCTDTKDPHPNFETCPADGVIKTPVIVKKPGLNYREVTSWRRQAGFSYRIEFKHPGSFYLMEVDYPNDAKRIIEVCINGKRTGQWNNVQSSSGAETGGRHLPDGKMEKLQWLHVADPGVHSVDIVNHHDNEKGAVGGIRIYRVKGRLPELAAGTNRVFGQYAERTGYVSGVGNVFGSGRIGYFDNPGHQSETNLTLMAVHIKSLEWWFDTCERYMQYNKFCGRNLLIMGCYQYNSVNTPFLRAPGYRTARVSQCARRMLAHFMNANNIVFFSEVEWSTPPYPLARKAIVSNPEVEAGADTPRMINRDGNQVNTWNWLHPEVKASYEKLMDDLVDSFGDLKAYRGVHTVLDPRSDMCIIPGFTVVNDHMDALFSSYDDITFGLFEKETGAKTGIASRDPNRFRARAKLLEENSALREQFLAWRGRKLTELFAGVAARIRQKRGDLEVALVPLTSLFLWNNWVPQLFEALEKKDKNLGLETYLQTFGVNVKDLDASPGVFVGRWAMAWIRSRQNKYNTSQDPYLWLGQTAARYTDLFNRYSSANRYVTLLADWNESYFNGPGTQHARSGKSRAEAVGDSDWLRTRQLIRCHSQFGGLNAREPITQALIVSDPNMLTHAFSDVALPIGHEQELRSIVRIISCLPKELFEPVLNTRLDTNLAIRQLKKGNETWFYVANPCQWPIKGWLELANSGTIFSVPDDKKLDSAAAKLPIELEPFGLVAFRSDSGSLQITGYQTEPLDNEWLERIKGVIQSIRAFIKANAEKYMIAAADQTALEEQLKGIEASLARNEYAAAWSALTLPEVWKYYIYEPSVEARYFGDDIERRRKEQLSNNLSTNKALLPPEYPKENNPNTAETRELNAVRTTGPIKIDGVLSEPDWQNKVFSSDFWSCEGRTNSSVETGVCALYDDQALYLAFACADPDTAGLEAKAIRERDVFSGEDDAVGFLLYAKGQGSYYQFGLNTRQARFDQQNIIGGKKLYEEFQPEWQFASQTHPQYWIAEVRIPWKSIGLDKPPEQMGANFFRVFRYRAVDGGIWNRTPDAHDVNRFGIVSLN